MRSNAGGGNAPNTLNIIIGGITMTEHVHIHNFTPGSNCSFYDVDIFQSAYDKICISLHKDLCSPDGGTCFQFDIPIKKAPGFCWKCNTASIGEKEGKAENIIKLFQEWDSFAWASIRKLIFEHPKKRLTPGL